MLEATNEYVGLTSTQAVVRYLVNRAGGQEPLAAMTGVAQGTISEALNAVKQTRRTTLNRLGAPFGFDWRDLERIGNRLVDGLEAVPTSAPVVVDIDPPAPAPCLKTGAADRIVDYNEPAKYALRRYLANFCAWAEAAVDKDPDVAALLKFELEHIREKTGRLKDV